MRSVLRILFWTYERGTWQYDILCVFILAFIFLTPPAVFDGSAFFKEQGSFFKGDDEEPRKSRVAITVGERMPSV